MGVVYTAYLVNGVELSGNENDWEAEEEFNSYQPSGGPFIESFGDFMSGATKRILTVENHIIQDSYGDSDLQEAVVDITELSNLNNNFIPIEQINRLEELGFKVISPMANGYDCRWFVVANVS